MFMDGIQPLQSPYERSLWQSHWSRKTTRNKSQKDPVHRIIQIYRVCQQKMKSQRAFSALCHTYQKQGRSHEIRYYSTTARLSMRTLLSKETTTLPERLKIFLKPEVFMRNGSFRLKLFLGVQEEGKRVNYTVTCCIVMQPQLIMKRYCQGGQVKTAFLGSNTILDQAKLANKGIGKILQHCNNYNRSP